MKKHTPQALAAAEKWARLTTGFLAALLLFYAYWMLADLELVPTPAFLPDFLFAGAVRNTLHTVILACAAEAGFWHNLAQETRREVPASTIRIALLILYVGGVQRISGREVDFLLLVPRVVDEDTDKTLRVNLLSGSLLGNTVELNSIEIAQLHCLICERSLLEMLRRSTHASCESASYK